MKLSFSPARREINRDAAPCDAALNNRILMYKQISSQFAPEELLFPFLFCKVILQFTWPDISLFPNTEQSQHGMSLTLFESDLFLISVC